MKKLIKLENDQWIEMRLSEDWGEITFWVNGNQIDGEFEFKVDDYNHNRYLLNRMYSPSKYKFMGIGKEVLKFFIEVTNGSIWARPNDGIVLNDGSHLTENAPSFVRARRRDGLIE